VFLAGALSEPGHFWLGALELHPSSQVMTTDFGRDHRGSFLSTNFKEQESLNDKES
jgi:hypothetical protein